MDDIRTSRGPQPRRVSFGGPDAQPSQPVRRPIVQPHPLNRPLHQNITTPPIIQVNKQRSKKPFIIFIILLLLAGGAGAGYWFMVKKKSQAVTPVTATESIQPEVPVQEKKTLRLIAGGDFIAHDALNAEAKTPAGYDYAPIMKNFQPYFQKADVRFCVQGVPGGGEAYGISGYPVFNSPLEFIRDMTGLGCNVINTGTNHTNDKGQPLINATLDAWDKQQNLLAVAGANRSDAERAKIRYFSNSGIKFAFLSYVTYNNTNPANAYSVNTFDEATAGRELATARQTADIVLVSMRWGTEYSPDINPVQERLGQFLADNGADIVFGHGQHVQGPVKKVTRNNGGETLVWYGIGNFVHAQLQPETLFNGVPVVDIDLATKKVSKVAFLPFYMHYEWTPEQKSKQDLLSRKNFMMYTFDQSAEPLGLSQNKTTIADQTKRLTDVLNRFTKVDILEANQY